MLGEWNPGNGQGHASEGRLDKTYLTRTVVQPADTIGTRLHCQPPRRCDIRGDGEAVTRWLTVDK